MSIFQVIITIINCAAVVIAPIIAVVIAQRLQDRAEKRNDKMKLFKTLMTSRIYGWSIESVHALNSIDIIFFDDDSVRAAWKELYDKYQVVDPDQIHLKKIENAQYKLLETMANSLGYKDKITWETIQNPYIPRGLVQQLEFQKINQQAYSDLLTSMNKMVPSSEADEKNITKDDSVKR